MERARGGFPRVCTNGVVGWATLTYFDVVVLDEKLDALEDAALRLLLAAVVARRLVLNAEFVSVHVDHSAHACHAKRSHEVARRHASRLGKGGHDGRTTDGADLRTGDDKTVRRLRLLEVHCRVAEGPEQRDTDRAKRLNGAVRDPAEDAVRRRLRVLDAPHRMSEAGGNDGESDGVEATHDVKELVLREHVDELVVHGDEASNNE
mmetsp:Transcript_43632/g.118598  ORF Transcript_43632/g.118598 Transcript_43632/m.118598 type:complete len:206 (-) Transcript_43632:929-1546(-)